MSRFAASSGSSIWYEEAGSGPPVLALHGVGGGAYFFSGLSERLGGRYRIVAIDYPGVGLSTAAPEAFSVEGWVRDLGEMVTNLFDGPVTIIGHSLGTIVALECWNAWATRISSMIFVGGLPEVRPAIRARLLERCELIARDGIEGWGRRVAPGVFGQAALHTRPEVVGLFTRIFDGQPADVYVRSLRLLTAASAERVVPAVTVPCFSISGSEDAYAPPDAVSAFLDRFHARPDQTVLPGVGHMPFFEAPERFADVVGSCLDRAAGRIASPVGAP
jgi:pimeloyl-ACP methyl ester carboxylesterase